MRHISCMPPPSPRRGEVELRRRLMVPPQLVLKLTVHEQQHQYSRHRQQQGQLPAEAAMKR